MKKSQVSIEFVLMFIALAMLILGATRVWIFFNADFANRQTPYEESRIYAGNDRRNPNPADPVWPPPNWQPINLTEEWVLQGDADSVRQ